MMLKVQEKHVTRYLLIVFSLWFLATPSIARTKHTVTCQVSIVGGGIAGLYTAYQLSKLSNDNPNRDVCLFEKEDRVGGRVHDIALNPAKPDLLYGLGALRVMEGQENVLALARELGIELERAPYRDNLINARGHFLFSSDELNRLAFPELTKAYVDDSGMGTENMFYAMLEQHRLEASIFYDIRTFSRYVLGPQGFQFLTDATRFRGEFNRPVDARAYLDYAIEDAKHCCVPSYPIGGMSQFAKKMAERAAKNGVRFFMSQPAEELTKLASAMPYQVITPDFIASSKKLVIATDPFGLSKINGSLALAIKAKPQFQDLIGMKVVVVNQQWPTDWWTDAGYEGKNVSRAWTAEHCLNFIEIPVNDYASRQLVTRSVYCDDPSCNEFWENIMEKGGIAAVASEVQSGLKHLFPNANIPSPTRTVMKVWPAAWFWLKAGTQFSIEDIATWAKKPLGDDSLSLVGEGYFIKRSGWIDGAIRSAKNTLRSQFGVN